MTGKCLRRSWSGNHFAELQQIDEVFDEAAMCGAQVACLGLAAARHAGLPVQGRCVGIVISGGNVDLPRYAELLSAC
ncbi:hypothetical protein UB46_05415 [Burkholderiaceae bacterium 16]|nr:hypothetical protein UB46_05415 [Burkholderiaceae bacterium 16]